jgi:hypothetical protein
MFLIWALPLFVHQTTKARDVRGLAWRSLAASGGLASCFAFRSKRFSKAAISHAHLVAERYAAEDLFLNLDWRLLAAFERNHDWQSFPLKMEQWQRDTLERVYGPASGRHVLASSMLEEINSMAWGLSARIAWRRYGPLALTLLGTFSAFAVSLVVWFAQAGSSPLYWIEEWGMFLLNMFRTGGGH